MKKSLGALVAAISILAACGADIETEHAVSQDAEGAETLPTDVADPLSIRSQRQISDSATGRAPATRLRPVEPTTGRMIGARGSSSTLMGVDLATGRFRALDGNAELAGIGLSRRDAVAVTRRDRGVASGVVITVDDCIEQRDDTICVLYTDREGNVEEFFSLDGSFPGPAKTSFDGRHVLIERSDRAVAASSLTVRKRDGTFVRSYNQSAGLDRRGAYDWLPDDRLVYSIEGNELLGDAQPTGFVIADPFGTAANRRIILPSFWQGGRIKTIESSPDGNTLLINLEPRVGATRPILVDLDTLLVRQLIEREDDSVVDAKNVVWGPNGQWVYVVVSTSKLLSGPGLGGGTVVFIGSFDSLFAYRVDGSTHPMPLDPEDLSDSVRLIPTDDPDDPGGERGGGKYQSNLIWVP